MANFGRPTHGLSSKQRPLIVHNLGPISGYTFYKAKTSGDTSYWECSACRSAKDSDKNGRKLPTVRVRNEVLLDDPGNPKNPHICQAFDVAEIQARQIVRQASAEVRNSGKRPRDAYNSAMVQITENFAVEPEHRDNVEAAMPVFKSVHASFYRGLASRYPVIHDVASIPNGIKLTLAGCNAAYHTDPHFDERYLIFQQSEPPMLVFSSPLDIEVLHQSAQLVADGTFTFRPSDILCSQMYVILGFLNGEAVPIVMGLMPDRKIPTYVTMFTAIRNRLVSQFGNVGGLNGGVINLDFEEAAISAFGQVFPELTVKGCLFHFSQSVLRNIGRTGLKSVYEQSEVQGFNLPQFQLVKPWVRRLMRLAFLPPHLIVPVFDRLLSVPPYTGNDAVDGNLITFGNYFAAQWMTPAMVQLISVFDGPGHRTTNHAEGTNNSYRAKFGEPRPRLSVFLVHFQEIHHAQQVRIRQLRSNATPRPRRAEDIRRDEAIQRFENEFTTEAVVLANAQPPSYAADLDQLILKFIDRCQRFAC